MSDGLRIIVSHPARQVNVYYRPLAAERMGAEVVFLTGLYYRPDQFPYSLVRYLPSAKKEQVEAELKKRRLEGLAPNNVVSLLGPALELTFRPMGKLREWYSIHDWLASRWIDRHESCRENSRTVVLHCFQGAGLRTLRAASHRNLVRLFEVTLPTIPRIPELEGFGEKSNARLQEELREAEFVLVQNDYSAQAVESMGISPDQIIRCHLGVDTSYYRPRTDERKPGPIRVLFLGGTSLRKGLHHLLQAWSELRLPDAELLLSGYDTAGLDKLPRDIPNCRILGKTPDKQFLKLLHHADILVHPSLAEGGCNVVYEALACGLPCIVSSNATSAVRTGREGIVFTVGDVEMLKKAIQMLCRENELRQNMAEAARIRAESLSWEQYLIKLGSIYEGLKEYSRNRSLETRQHLLTLGF